MDQETRTRVMVDLFSAYSHISHAALELPLSDPWGRNLLRMVREIETAIGVLQLQEALNHPAPHGEV